MGRFCQVRAAVPRDGRRGLELRRVAHGRWACAKERQMTREMFFVALGLGVPLIGWIAAEVFILRHLHPFGKG